MINAPTGTVALVFSDIQGSTVLWERLGDTVSYRLTIACDGEPHGLGQLLNELQVDVSTGDDDDSGAVDV